MLNWLLTWKLREFACTLRSAHANGQSLDALRFTKDKMLLEVYQILAVSLGEPPETFDWSYRNKSKEFKSYRGMNPMKFYDQVVGYSLADTVSVINDPRNEYCHLYTVEYLGNVVGGRRVTYLNMPIEKLKEYAIRSIQDNFPGKQSNSTKVAYTSSVVWM